MKMLDWRTSISAEDFAAYAQQVMAFASSAETAKFLDKADQQFITHRMIDACRVKHRASMSSRRQRVMARPVVVATRVAAPKRARSESESEAVPASA